MQLSPSNTSTQRFHISALTSLSFMRLGVWLIVAGLFITPLALVVGLALGGNQFPALWDSGLGKALWNSAYTTVLSAVGATIIGTIMALTLDRTDVFGRTALRLFLLSPLLIPPFIGAIAWLQLFGKNQGINRFSARKCGIFTALMV